MFHYSRGKKGITVTHSKNLSVSILTFMNYIKTGWLVGWLVCFMRAVGVIGLNSPYHCHNFDDLEFSVELHFICVPIIC